MISTENAEFQIIQSLKLNRNKRSKAGEIFIEGIESLKQAIRAGIEFTRLITVDVNALSQWGKDVLRRNTQAKIIEMKEELYKKLCDREEPSELIATAKIKDLKLHEVETREKPFILIFDRPSDHGNLGALVRSANSFNVDAIFVVGHAIDVYDPKVIRSSLGSIFHSKIVKIDSTEELRQWIEWQRKNNALLVVGSDSTGSVALQDVQLKTPIALILGNEAKGMSLTLKEMSDLIVRIPISGNVNSLNVSCAGSILLWEIYRNSSFRQLAEPAIASK